MDFAERLATLRQERNLTQEELAEKLNIARQSVSRWESRTSIPNMDSLILLSNFFGISMDELVTGKRRVPEEPPAPAIPEADVTEPVVEPEPAQSDEPVASPGRRRILYAVIVLLLMVLTAVGSWAFFSYQNRDRVIPIKELPVAQPEDEADYQEYTFIIN